MTVLKTDMRGALFQTIVVVLLLGSSAAAQSSMNDMDRLRELLSLAPGKQIPKASSLKILPGGGTLRVFLAPENDKEIRRYYVREIKQWNRYKNADIVALELVDDVSRADIILAKYKLNEKPQSSENSIAVYEQVYDPATRTTISKPEIRTEVIRSVRFNGYILRRNGADVEILRQRIVIETKKDGGLLVEGLWTTFVEMLSAS